MLHYAHQLKTKSGLVVDVRPPDTSDCLELVRYANELSQEDTYLTLSGEDITRFDQERYLEQILAEIDRGDRYHLFGFTNGKLIANADVHRVTRFRSRCLHVGEVAISVAKEFRGQGLGRQLLEMLITGSRHMKGIRMLTLDVFSINTKALELYTKLGFKIIGEIPEGVLYKDNYIGHTFMYLPLESA